MKNIILTIFVFALLISSCKKNESPSSTNPSADELLQQKIVGNWRSLDYRRVSFMTDGSFTDTIFAYGHFGSNPDTMIFTMMGTYFLQNSVIEYSNVHFNYITASGRKWPGFGGGSYPHYVRLSGDSLEMIPTDVLTSESTTQLAGNWKSVTWSFLLPSDSLVDKYVSRLEKLYTLKQDSAIYSVTWNYLDPPSPPIQTYYGTYQYSPPNLKVYIYSDTTRMRVSYLNSKMYWIHDEWAHSFVRVK